MKRGRMTKQEQDVLYRFIANLMYNRTSEVMGKSGNISPSIVMEKIKEELGMSICKQAATNILKKDLSGWKDKKPVSNSDIKNIVKQLTILNNILDNPLSKPYDKVRAANAYSNLMKTKLAWEKQCTELDIKKSETERPVYAVKFGNYTNVLKRCPKCGNKFYDTPDKKDSNSKLPAKTEEPAIVAGNGQSTLYKSTEKNKVDGDDKK